jgi:hypothetical protein
VPVKSTQKRLTRVREHPRKVPKGITVVDEHLRLVHGRFLSRDMLEDIVSKYPKNVKRPSPCKMEFKDGAKYDDLIAVWTDYFNKKFSSDSSLDPNVVKALIASESSFEADPKNNKVAFGITQVTPSTLKILQDSKGESKDFVFKNIRQKYLKDPKVAIPLGVRWLFHKKQMAKRKLKREPSEEEIILEYKGLLKSNTDLKQNALRNFKEHYEALKRNSC